ncbi:hypothetical protein BDV10DRAFT_161386 [Aspergillus recurvatus]
MCRSERVLGIIGGECLSSRLGKRLCLSFVVGTTTVGYGTRFSTCHLPRLQMRFATLYRCLVLAQLHHPSSDATRRTSWYSLYPVYTMQRLPSVLWVAGKG